MICMHREMRRKPPIVEGNCTYSLHCARHILSSNKYYTSVIFFSLFSSTAAHAMCMDENPLPHFVLNRSVFLGEAALQATLEIDAVCGRLPEIENTPIALKLSELLGEVPLLVSAQPVLAPSALVPSAAAPPAPLPPAPLAVKKAVSKKVSTKKQLALLKALSDFKHKLDRLLTLTKKQKPAVDTMDTGPRIGFAPMIWGGEVSDTLRWAYYSSGGGEGSWSLDNSESISLSARSYIWQPWIALVNGGIGLSHNISSSNGSYSGSGTSLTWNAGASLFAKSRFPLNASYDSSDSRTETAMTNIGTDYTSKTLMLSQTYIPLNNSFMVAWFFNRNIMESQSFAKDSVSSFSGDFSKAISANQNIKMYLTHTESSQDRGNSGLIANSFAVNHDWYSEYINLNINSYANTSNNDYRSQNSQNMGSNTSRYLMAGSAITWSSEDKPLTAGSSVTFSDIESNTSQRGNHSQNISGSVMASYRPTKNISLTGSGNISAIKSTNASSLMISESGNASYSGDIVQFGKDDANIYNWNISGGVNNTNTLRGSSQTAQSLQVPDNTQTYSLSGSHSVSFPYTTSSGIRLSNTASQGLSNSYSPQSGRTHSLSHSFSTTTPFSETAPLEGDATLSLSDGHSFGTQKSDSFQNADFSLNGRKQLTKTSIVNASARLGLSRQGGTGDTSTFANANVTYSRANAFNVRGLQYMFSGDVNTSVYNARLSGDATAERMQSGISINQSLLYRIGMLNTSLIANFSQFSDNQNASIFIRVSRIFGRM